MSFLNLFPIFAFLVALLVCTAEAKVNLAPPRAVRLPRCRCFPKEIIEIAQSSIPCYDDDKILVRTQLNTRPSVIEVLKKLLEGWKLKHNLLQVGKAKVGKTGRFRPKPPPIRRPRQASWGETDTPMVSFNMTYIVDDIAHFYMDGVLVTCDSTAPKRRIRVELKDVPCTDIVVRVENESPRCKTAGGGGVAILIEHEGKKYASVPDDVEHPCEDEDKDEYCFNAGAQDIIPIPGKGTIMPADNCFPFTPFFGSNYNNCKVTRLNKVETCHLAFELGSDESDSLVKPTCDPGNWKLPLLAADTLPDNPLCEFVAMGRNGGITSNPVDGSLPDKIVYGVRFELPFCHK